MITKNFKNFTATLLYAFGSNRALSGKGLFPFKDKNGNTYYLVARFDGIYPAVISEGLVDSSNDYGYCVGSSDAAESEDAYNLSSPILSGLQIDTVYAGPNYNTTKQRMEYSRTIKLANTSQSAITIREVGIFQPVRYANSRNAQGDESLTKAMLIDRTVLSTPLTIQPGTTHGVKYSVAAMVQYNPTNIKEEDINMIRTIDFKYLSGYGDKHYIEAAGLSTDSKPTANLVTGSLFLEVDTGKVYAFDEDSNTWNPIGG